MFGKNEKVGLKYFADTDSLLVTTTFFTLQGEGPFAGMPAIFLRLAKCNLACSFCDTYFDSGDWYTSEQLHRAVKAHIPLHYFGKRGNYNLGLVVTGGEPSLQRNTLPSFLEEANHNFVWTQVESNGILPVDYPPRTILVVSPKCAEKDGVPTHYLKPHERTLQRADFLKFVISADPNSLYHTIPDWAFEWREQTDAEIYISPINEYNDTSLTESRIRGERVSFWEPALLDNEMNKRNHEYAAEFVLSHNLRLSLQQQLYASLP